MDRSRRELLWTELRVRILDVLQEVRSQDERMEHMIPQEKPSPDDRIPYDAKPENCIHSQVQRIERRLVDHFNLVECFVLKHEAEYEKMQALFLRPQEEFVMSPARRQCSPFLTHEAAPEVMGEHDPMDLENGAGSMAIARTFSQVSQDIEAVFDSKGNSSMIEDEGLNNLQEKETDYESQGFTAQKSVEAAEELRKLHERWQDVKHGISERRLQRSRTTSAKIQRTLGLHEVRKEVKVKDTRMMRCVNSVVFTGMCSALIVLNAVFIGYQSEASFNAAMQVPPANDPHWFKTVGRIFLGCFLVELLLRIVALRTFFIIGPDWQWNIFDLLLVMTSAVEELLDTFNVSFFRTLRILRMVRTLRIIRVLRFFRELRQMVSSILHTLSSLAWALILLLLIMYLFSIVFMQAAAGYIKEPDNEAVRSELILWFSTMLYTMYALFRAISGGQDWYELQNPLGKISFVYSGFFAAYVFFVVFGVLNVLISVFVERASESGKLDRDLVTQAEQKATDNFTQEMHDVFLEIDVDRLGYIQQKQFDEYMQDNTVKAFFKTRNLDAAAHRLFNIYDAEDKRVQQMDVDEFIIRMMRLRGGARAADVQLLLQDGRLQYQKMKGLMRVLDKKLNAALNHLHAEAKASAPQARTSAQQEMVWGGGFNSNAKASAPQVRTSAQQETVWGASFNSNDTEKHPLRLRSEPVHTAERQVALKLFDDDTSNARIEVTVEQLETKVVAV